MGGETSAWEDWSLSIKRSSHTVQQLHLYTRVDARTRSHIGTCTLRRTLAAGHEVEAPSCARTERVLTSSPPSLKLACSQARLLCVPASLREPVTPPRAAPLRDTACDSSGCLILEFEPPPIPPHPPHTTRYAILAIADYFDHAVRGDEQVKNRNHATHSTPQHVCTNR